MSTVNLFHAIATCEDPELKAKLIAECEAASKLAYDQFQKKWAKKKKENKKDLTRSRITATLIK